jgi:integrase
MASITETKGADGRPRYIVNYREPDGRQRRKTFRKKADATAFSHTMEADKLRGRYIDPDAGRITFRKYATDWLAAQTFEQTTRESTELRLRLHVFPVLGHRQLGQIKPSTVQAWLRGLTMAPSYQRVILSNVSTIMSAAVDDARLSANPCKAGSVRAPRVQTRKVTPWSAERVLAVREALPERYRIIVMLAAGLGLRQGEAFALSPGDVDFLRGVVEVRRQVRLLSSNRAVFALPKGGKTRTVPLPGSVRDALAAHLAAAPARPVTLPWRTVEGDPVKVPLVLSTREATALNRNYFNTFVWKAALDTAKVDPSRDNGIHALRHYYASVLLDAGENIKAVSSYLGHSDPGFTLRTYTHLMPSSSERTRKAVDDAMANSTPHRVAAL